MPRYDESRYDQKWSMWDTWGATVNRKLSVAVITAQHRFFQIITAQHRMFKLITAQYRNIKTRLGG